MIKADVSILHIASAMIGQNYAATSLALENKLSPEQLEEMKLNTLANLGYLLRYCRMIGLEFTSMYLEAKVKALEISAPVKEINIIWGELKLHVENELSRKLFMQIPFEDAKYYDQAGLFGAEVNANFPSSATDIQEAGNCYAVGRYTACVFHSMRVLEKGLHALVHEMNNTLQTNIVFNKQVEHMNWGTIIDKVEAEIRELLRPTRQPRLTPADLQFYSEAAKEFVYFKNAWRDDVSHSRSSYGQGTARDVLEHVRSFMCHLATRLKE